MSPMSSPVRIGCITSSRWLNPRSSSEKAGVPIADVHRSQLDMPPTSAQPVGNKNRKEAIVAASPITTEETVTVVLDISSEDI